VGDDTPMAVLLSQRVRSPRLLPVSGSLRSPIHRSTRCAKRCRLEVCLGAERNIFEESPEHAFTCDSQAAVISPAKWRALMSLGPLSSERHLIGA
jgi:glutamate synthase (NADPH/NADH) large chain